MRAVHDHGAMIERTSSVDHLHGTQAIPLERFANLAGLLVGMDMERHAVLTGVRTDRRQPLG